MTGFAWPLGSFLYNGVACFDAILFFFDVLVAALNEHSLSFR